MLSHNYVGYDARYAIILLDTFHQHDVAPLFFSFWFDDALIVKLDQTMKPYRLAVNQNR